MKRKDCDVKLVKTMLLTCSAPHTLCESQRVRVSDYDSDWDTPATEAEPVMAHMV